MAELGLLCTQAFLQLAASGDLSLVAVRGFLIVMASSIAEHRLWGEWASVATESYMDSVVAAVQL